jgi:hypothetical protein
MSPIVLDAETTLVGVHALPSHPVLANLVFGPRVLWAYHSDCERDGDELGAIELDLRQPQAPLQTWRLPVQMRRHHSVSGQDPCVGRDFKFMTVIGDAPIFRLTTTYISHLGAQYFPYYVYGFSSNQQRWYRLEPDIIQKIASQTWLSPARSHPAAPTEHPIVEQKEHYFGTTPDLGGLPTLALTSDGQLEVTFTHLCDGHFEYEDDSPRYEKSYLKPSDQRRFPNREDSGDRFCLKHLSADRWLCIPYDLEVARQARENYCDQMKNYGVSPFPQELEQFRRQEAEIASKPTNAYVFTNLVRCLSQFDGRQDILGAGKLDPVVIEAVQQDAVCLVVWIKAIGSILIFKTPVVP